MVPSGLCDCRRSSPAATLPRERSGIRSSAKHAATDAAGHFSAIRATAAAATAHAGCCECLPPIGSNAAAPTGLWTAEPKRPFQSPIGRIPRSCWSPTCCCLSSSFGRSVRRLGQRPHSGCSDASVSSAAGSGWPATFAAAAAATCYATTTTTATTTCYATTATTTCTDLTETCSGFSTSSKASNKRFGCCLGPSRCFGTETKEDSDPCCDNERHCRCIVIVFGLVCFDGGISVDSKENRNGYSDHPPDCIGYGGHVDQISSHDYSHFA